MSLLEAGFNPKRDKLIVSVDDEMVEKIRAESQADMDPVEIEQQRLLEEKKPWNAQMWAVIPLKQWLCKKK